MASQPARQPEGDQAPDLAELKRRAEQLIGQFEAAASCRRCAGCASCNGDAAGYLDARRDLVVATQLRQAAELLARAAHAEEVREAVTGRTPPPRRPSRRMLRAVHAAAICGGLAGAAAIGAEALLGGIT